MQVVLLTPPGMIVSPPARLEQMFETPIAKSVRFGSDLRRNGSILSIAAIVASDSTPSIRVRVRTVVASAHQSEWSANSPRKFGSTMPCLNGLSGMWIRWSPPRPRNQPRTSPTTAAITCGGTTFSHRALSDASAKISARQKMPTKKTFGSMLQELRRRLAHDAPELVRCELVADEQGQLLGDDQQADRREHPLDHRGGEDRGEAGQLEPGQDDLHQARQADGHQQQRVADRAVAPAEQQHRGEQRGRQPGGRAADRHVGAAQERQDQPGDDRRDQPADRRCARRHGDPQREGQRDQRDHQPRDQVVSPVLQPGQPVPGLLKSRRVDFHRRCPFGLGEDEETIGQPARGRGCPEPVRFLRVI